MNPERIGPYRIERKIGAGGMGTVYLGVHETSGRQAAIKVLPPMLAREGGFVARFEREIAALRKLSHPNVVELYESSVEGDLSYYAMEYVDGVTLMDRLHEQRRISWQQVIEIGVQICGALKAAHNAGIIHRDLKPSNLMLTADGQVKLTDFGVAQVFASGKLTITGGVIGTAEYMSPEQAAGKRAEKRSDIYSLGAVMYVMLTGRPPFTGKTSFDVARQHQTARFDSPRMVVPEIPYWLDEVVCQCLEKKPEDRYPDAYVLSRRLEEIPRKVALAAQDHTLDFDESSPTAETLASDFRDEAARGPAPQVGATLVRDLVRAQLEEERPATPLARALENTWILIGLLGLLIFGGVLWFRNVNVQSIPAEEPLTLSANDEVNHFLRRARHQRDTGRPLESQATLQALLRLLPEGADYETDRDNIRRQLDRIEQAQPQGVYPLLETALQEARRLHEAGDTTAARRICHAILALYDPTDPSARTGVTQARRLLEESNSPTPKADTDSQSPPDPGPLTPVP
jgi:serine/threonine protein kinase